MILENYYAAPIFTPSRSDLMTVKYPIHTGIYIEMQVWLCFSLLLIHYLLGMHHDVIRQRTGYGKLIVTFVLTLKNVNILYLKRYPLRREATWTSNLYEKSMESGTWAILVSCTLPPTEVSTPSMAIGYYSPYHGYYDHLVFNPVCKVCWWWSFPFKKILLIKIKSLKVIGLDTICVET